MHTQTKIALAGGGGADDSRLLDEVFAAWIGAQGKLLYWPIALRGAQGTSLTFQSCSEWITGTFAPLGVTHITMWTDLSTHQAAELDEYDAVYIGGGNTFSLLHELRESGFDRYLETYALQGKAVYGGSAGAAVLGRDIRTVNHIDHNHIGLAETRGLDLAQGHAVWVHYTPEDDALIAAYIQEYRQPILAISEQSGIVIEEGSMRSVGFEPAYRFDENGKTGIAQVTHGA